MLARVEASPGALVGGRFANGVPANRWAEATHLILDVVVAHTHRRGSPLAFAVTANLALHADVFRAVGGFDERFDRNAAEDRDFCARCLEAGHPLVLAPEAVVRHPTTAPPLGFLRLHATYGQRRGDLPARAPRPRARAGGRAARPLPGARRGAPRDAGCSATSPRARRRTPPASPRGSPGAASRGRQPDRPAAPARAA